MNPVITAVTENLVAAYAALVSTGLLLLRLWELWSQKHRIHVYWAHARFTHWIIRVRVSNPGDRPIFIKKGIFVCRDRDLNMGEERVDKEVGPGSTLEFAIGGTEGQGDVAQVFVLDGTYRKWKAKHNSEAIFRYDLEEPIPFPDNVVKWAARKRSRMRWRAKRWRERIAKIRAAP